MPAVAPRGPAESRRGMVMRREKEMEETEWDGDGCGGFGLGRRLYLPLKKWEGD